jgi:DNA-binding CsgD family transcriptional regulator
LAFVLRSDDQWLEVSDLFGAAALGDGWGPALNRFADACGGAHGQLIGVSAEPAIRFNWLPRMGAAALDEFVEIGGAEPAKNPRARMGLRLPVLEAWHEADCAVEAQPGLGGSYADFCRRYDIPHGSQTNLVRDRSGLISLAVLRSQAQGPPDAEDRRAFEALAPHARSAVKFQLALEGRGGALLAGAIEGLGRPAFVCDSLGLVRNMTSQAEALLQAGIVRLRHGRLSAGECPEGRLEAAITRAQSGVLAPGQEQTNTIVLRRRDPDLVEVMDVIALPRAHYAFGFEPRVLIVARGPGRRQDEIEQLLEEAYALTASEARIAARLGAGESPDAIARARNVSPTTIRTQLRTIYQKMLLNRQVELAACISRFR